MTSPHTDSTELDKALFKIRTTREVEHNDNQWSTEFVYTLEEAKASIEALIQQEASRITSEATANVNRLEVIDDTGRAYVKGSIYGTPVSIKLDYQDDGRTLKVFVKDHKEEV